MKIKKLKITNYCLQCGKKFTTTKRNVVTCSPECALKRKQEKDKRYWQNYYEKNKDKILEKNRNWWQKNKVNKTKKPIVKKEPFEKECATCGKKFTTRSNKVIHCIDHRYRRRPTNVFKCKCSYCGDEFWSKHKTDDVCLNPDCIKKSLKESK